MMAASKFQGDLEGALRVDGLSGEVFRNLSPAQLYEHSLLYERGARIASSGALMAFSGEKTGRSPDAKRVVQHPDSEKNVWWAPTGGAPNFPLSEDSFNMNRKIATEFIAAQQRMYIVDGFVNWGSEARTRVRVVCTRPYHALFMRNMMIVPSASELEAFGTPDFTIYNAGACPADPSVPGVNSTTSVAIYLEAREMVILGTEYAGEMKKGIFSVMHYMMPLRGILTLHSGCNVGRSGDVTLFFGLSGTGKTTLSADPQRSLLGDDEHCWSEKGVFNIEGGCYAKCINLKKENEPSIWNAIRFGTVLENCVADAQTGQVDFSDVSITQNTRASYSIQTVENAHVPCVGGHPKNILMLCCDAFGVLPPVSRLTSAQAMYYFISGYTSKVAGTEMGVTEPQATFSACFGGAFLCLHPMKYAAMLADMMSKHDATAWLINTGWTAGGYGTGHRMSLKHTRAIVDGIHSGAIEESLDLGRSHTLPLFNLEVPTQVPGVPSTILDPRKAWSNGRAYDKALQHLAGLFIENMGQYGDGGGYVEAATVAAISAAGPEKPEEPLDLWSQKSAENCAVSASRSAGSSLHGSGAAFAHITKSVGKV